MIEKIESNISGCFLLKPKKLLDDRGYLIKFYQKELFERLNIDLTTTESYFSISHQGVLRGMHFQNPPFDHHKLVTCLQGSVLDVVCDIRVGSPTYGQCASFELDGNNHSSVYIPAGLAHGFYAKSPQSTLLYNVSSSYQPDSDNGIAWNSLDFNWPDKSPIISNRDNAFLALSDVNSPFTMASHN